MPRRLLSKLCPRAVARRNTRAYAGERISTNETGALRRTETLVDRHTKLRDCKTSRLRRVIVKCPTNFALEYVLYDTVELNVKWPVRSRHEWKHNRTFQWKHNYVWINCVLRKPCKGVCFSNGRRKTRREQILQTARRVRRTEETSAK